jgi:hypothetical protein
MPMRTFEYLLIASAVITTGFPALRAQESRGLANEPAALEALTKMGAYLRSLQSFQVTAEVTEEDVLTDGQKIQYSTVANIVARKPDRLFATMAGDRYDRLFFYDGKTFTLYARRLGFYATAAAPPTVSQLAQLLTDKYGLEVPLEDLFLWGTERLDTSPISSAWDVGPAEVGGTTCEQYAFREPGLDWQIWVQQGDHPLPRKLVLTTTTDEARPQHISVLTWNLAPSYNEATFTFQPPENAHKIIFASGDGTKQPGGQP